MKIEIKIGEEQISNVLCCALEGGSNYWYMLGDFDRKHFIAGEPLVDNLTRSFMLDPDYKVEVLDLESLEFDDDDDDEGHMETLGYLTNASMAYAFQQLAEHDQGRFGLIIDMECDADDADVWFQTAVMGEVVFG